MRGGWGILSQPGKGRSLGRNGATVFSTVLLRTGIYHLKVVCLARLPFSQSIGQRGMAFLRPLFVCTHCCFWVPVFPALCLGYMEQTKKSRNSLTCHSLHVEVPSQSSFFLSPFNALCLFQTCLGVLAVLRGRNREKLRLLHLPRRSSLSYHPY